MKKLSAFDVSDLNLPNFDLKTEVRSYPISGNSPILEHELRSLALVRKDQRQLLHITFPADNHAEPTILTFLELDQRALNEFVADLPEEFTAIKNYLGELLHSIQPGMVR